MNVINFNRKLLPQRDKFKNTLGGYDSEKKAEYNLPKATTKQLNQIRERLKKDQKIRMIKVVVVTIILFLILISVLLYSANGFRESLWY